MKDKPSWTKIGIVGSITAAMTSLGPAVSAIMRNKDIVKTVLPTGLGPALFVASTGVAAKFGIFATGKEPASYPNLKQASGILAFLEATGIGANLLISTVTSSAPILDIALDTFLGFPVTLGMLCALAFIEIKKDQNAEQLNRTMGHVKSQ